MIQYSPYQQQTVIFSAFSLSYSKLGNDSQISSQIFIAYLYISYQSQLGTAILGKQRSFTILIDEALLSNTKLLDWLSSTTVGEMRWIQSRWVGSSWYIHLGWGVKRCSLSCHSRCILFSFMWSKWNSIRRLLEKLLSLPWLTSDFSNFYLTFWIVQVEYSIFAHFPINFRANLRPAWFPWVIAVHTFDVFPKLSNWLERYYSLII